MTASTLQSLALRLSNSCYCRHWIQWQTPTGPGSAWLMAIDCRDHAGRTASAGDDLDSQLARLGFRPEWSDGLTGWVWVIERTDEAGEPYREGV